MKPLQTSPGNAAVEEILNRYDENISALAFQLRAFLLEIHSANDIREPALKNLLKEAIKAYRDRLSDRT